MTRAIIIVAVSSAFAALSAEAQAAECDAAQACACPAAGHIAASPHHLGQARRGQESQALPQAEAKPAPIAERAAVPKALAAPKREAADKLFYAKIGGSGVPAETLRGGPDLGIGMRLELDRIGIDASMSLGVTQTGPKMEITGLRGSWVKLGAQYYLTPNEDSSPYLGGGLSWGGQRERVCNHTYSGTGLQAQIVAGYELLRSSTIRMFVQTDVTLPLYQAAHADQDASFARMRGQHQLYTGKLSADAPAQRYLPIMGLSLGIAWGQAHVIGVQKVK
jgi:hypothetical protein